MNNADTQRAMKPTIGMRMVVLLMSLLLSAGCRNRVEQEGARGQRIPSFQRDVLPVLRQQCASAQGCHGEKPTDSVHLDLRSGTAYAQLVNAPAQARKGALRITPGIPASSFLLDKLSGKTLGPREGKRMPLDPDTGVPFEHSPLSPDFVESALRPWILGGAPNN